jgi:hypothetical protein
MTYFETYENLKALKNKVPVWSIWENEHLWELIHVIDTKIKITNPRGAAKADAYFRFNYTDRQGAITREGIEARIGSLLSPYSHWRMRK